LKKLARELNTDLTTIDGFMWYISKKVRVIK
jgi:thermostable 8-oxoguanine DNA glycosylase